jgi:hypothetical protein
MHPEEPPHKFLQELYLPGARSTEGKWVTWAMCPAVWRRQRFAGRTVAGGQRKARKPPWPPGETRSKCHVGKTYLDFPVEFYDRGPNIRPGVPPRYFGTINEISQHDTGTHRNVTRPERHVPNGRSISRVAAYDLHG